MLEWYQIALVLLIAVGVDIGVRELAFKQVESIAIDIAIFSLVYSAIELAQADDGALGNYLKVFGGLLVLVLATLLHTWLRDQTDENVHRVITDCIECAGEHDNSSTALLHFEDIGKYAVLVALSAKLKQGKARRREALASQINRIHGISECDVSADDFLLDASVRRGAHVGFTVLGAISLIIPLLQVH